MPSLRARLTSLVLRLLVRPRFGKDSLATTRTQMDNFARLFKLTAGTRVEKISAGGVPGEWVTPAGVSSSRVLYYLHGGGYIYGSCDAYRPLVDRLARAMGTRALHLNYRLAPEHPFPAALDDALAAYRWLLATGTRPEEIVIAGDSAGGGLALATLTSLRDAGDPLPTAVALLSPWTDLAFTGASLKTRAAADPIFNVANDSGLVQMYLGALDPRTPLASPLYADLRQLPPLLIQVGNDEILLDDSTRLAERARAAGVDAAIEIWDGLWHVFQLFLFVPESGRAIDHIARFAQQHLGSPAPDAPGILKRAPRVL